MCEIMYITEIHTALFLHLLLYVAYKYSLWKHSVVAQIFLLFLLSRKHLSESQKTCEDLEARLKHQKSLVSATNSSRVGGLCLKCAQQEAVLAQTHSNVHMQVIERVTK